MIEGIEILAQSEIMKPHEWGSLIFIVSWLFIIVGIIIRHKSFKN